MSDAQPTTTTQESKWPFFGANQVIAIVFVAVVLGMTFGLTLRVEDAAAALDKWMNWVLVFLPLVLSIVLGLSAGIKAVKSFTSAPLPPEPAP